MFKKKLRKNSISSDKPITNDEIQYNTDVSFETIKIIFNDFQYFGYTQLRILGYLRHFKYIIKPAFFASERFYATFRKCLMGRNELMC